MKSPPPSMVERMPWLAYVLAVAATVVTLWLRLAFGYHPGDPPLLMLFLIPIMLSAYAGGLGPGLLATVLAVFGGDYYLLPPVHTFSLNRTNLSGLMTLVVVSILINVLVQSLRSSRDRLKAALRESAWLASFPEQNPNPIIELDLMKNQIHYVNPAARQLFPDLESLGAQHPLLAGLQEAARTSLDPHGVMWREVAAGSSSFSQTVSYIGESQRLRVYSTDITARRLAEETLLRLAAIVNSSEDAIISKTLEGIITSWNHAAEKIFGYAAEEVIGRPMLILFPPECLNEETDILRRVARGARVEPYDTVRLRKGGQPVNVSVTVSPIIDAGGKIIGASKIARDITERKRAEMKAEESEHRFRTMADSIAQLAWIGRPDGFLTWYNRRWYDYTGTTPEQMEGWGWQRVHDPLVLARVIENWTLAINAAQPFEMEFPLRGADGTYRRFLTRALPLKDAGGNVVQWFGTNTDVDELKRSAEALRDSEARFRALFEQSPIGIALGDVATTGFTSVNQRFCEIVGYPREELMQMNLKHFAHPEDLPADPDHFAPLMAGNRRHYQMEKRCLQKGGADVWVSLTVVPLWASSEKPNYYIAVIEDITARKGAEDVIKKLNASLERRVAERTAQLEAANKELEAFSYSVSHDLRAPLRAVNGFAGIVLEDYAPLLPEDGKKYLMRIRNGGKQMGQLIDDLLAFSRLGRQTMKKDVVNISLLVKNVCEELKPLWGSGREIEFRIGDLPPAYGDASLLKQVWTNLISNAVKYSRDRRPAVVEMGWTGQGGEPAYFIRDNGAGFDMKYAHKLFGVFQRLHRADEFEGTGVGLAIVQRIVHRHGGRIWAEARENHGATFYFTLESKDQL